MKKKNLLISAIAIFGLAKITVAQVPSYVPTNGLVGWWPFNGNANDESGNGNNGTVNGATLTSDRFGNANTAYSFDGDTSYIQSLNPLGNCTSDFTMSCFVRLNSFDGGLFVHVGIDQNSFPRDGFGFGVGGTQAIFQGQNLLGLVSNVAWYQSGYQFSSVNTWYHVLVVRIGNIVKYYVDGVNIGSSIISSIPPPSNALFFGSGATSYANLDGILDDIGIWNRALTQQEITDLYNANPININENIQSNLFSVFPNPAQSVINIKADTKLIGEVYTIYDNTGKVVLSGKLNTESTTIELGNLSDGIYIFSVGENMKQAFKIIKE